MCIFALKVYWDKLISQFLSSYKLCTVCQSHKPGSLALSLLFVKNQVKTKYEFSFWSKVSLQGSSHSQLSLLDMQIINKLVLNRVIAMM